MTVPRPAPWSTRARCVAVLATLALAGALFAFGWDRGPDVLIDYGRELYVPWRLTLGDVLHRDIGWFNGPLGPWVLQAWMEQFGVSLDAVQALDVLVTLCALLLLALLFRSISDAATATCCAVVFLMVFAVAQQEEVGNFLFASPYSHGITFGFVLGLGAILGLSRASGRRGYLAAAAAGVMAGLAFLTKAEMFLAVASACAAMLIGLAARQDTRRSARRAAPAFAVGAALPLAWAFLRFRSEIGSEGAPRALLGTWPYAFDERIGEMKFYAMMRGTDDPALHLGRMAKHAVLTSIYVAAVFAAARWMAGRVRTARIASAAGGALAVVATLGVLTVVRIKWLLVPLPIVLTALGAIAILHLRRGAPARAVTELGIVVFAGMLLPKVALLPLARQYGFVLSVPGTLLIVTLLVYTLPGYVALRADPTSRARAFAALRAAGIGIALVFAVSNLNATRNWFARKTVEFGAGGDRLWADGYRGVVMKELARDLDARLADDASLLVLPEGIVLNYQLRRRTPTRVVNFMPPELVFFEPASIVSELAGDPPDAVVLIRRPTDVYGYPFFGEGYGESILDWVREHYVRDRLIGDEPFGDGTFGASILVPRAAR